MSVGPVPSGICLTVRYHGVDGNDTVLLLNPVWTATSDAEAVDRMHQKEAFLRGEGDRWYERNSISVDNEVVLPIIRRHGLYFSDVLEIGSTDGRRLLEIKAVYPHVNLTGVDPSQKAVSKAVPGIFLLVATADDLPFQDDSFDLVIFGYCLYLCDRTDLFKIAAAADRVLRDHGTMIVYDFHPPQPYCNPYKHLNGVFTYKMDHSRMFSWNPAYQVISLDVFPDPGTTSMDPDNRVGITVMRKDIAEGWGNNCPFFASDAAPQKGRARSQHA
jgi:SAM-dependent methyltransferase